ncbi:helix-turn-helix transcriptional regulator [Streptomyces sp. FH025]|uniref:helix-turn-helix domain-containing protein n=1 Tax=Streptomyces sp. FH025 TaxID=2815937 RepID=UPI001A9FE7A5|nr:helix-turn-helix transcriptional regulator [Streptomyces sp. FH025]MBO1418829.1 helix-turn-helix transcriptional regulator [Streptomyces sp. FH025]
MGRLNSALAVQHQEVRALARWLRALRERSGLTYSQMARTTVELQRPVSVATLSRADEGRTVPTWPVTQAYTRACGGSLRTAERLWLRADARRSGRSARPAVAVQAAGLALRYVTQPHELLLAMRRLRLRAGNPSLRELEARAMHGPVSHLPRSTLHGVLSGRRDCSERILAEFVRACGAGPGEETEWLAALRRVHDGGTPPAALRRRLAEAETELAHLRALLQRATGEPAPPARHRRSRPPAAPPQARPPQRQDERTP